MTSVNIRPYHHGNLRAELLRLAVELAAEGGPEAIVLREVARRAGVSASAAYRHFSGHGELMDAVRVAALEGLSGQMREALDQLPAQAGAMSSLLAAGEGYFSFGIEQPALFRVLHSSVPMEEIQNDRAPTEDPFALLRDIVATARPNSDEEQIYVLAVSLWSAVHGYTMLCTEGALRQVPEERQRAMLPEVLGPPARAVVGEPT